MKTPIEQAIEALKKAGKMLYDAADRGNYPPEALQVNGGEGLGFIDAALSVLQSMEGAEPKAWYVESKDWGVVTSPVRWADECKPLYAHPSPSVPRLTVEEAMEVYDGWEIDRNAIMNSGLSARNDLRERLTKAAKP